MSKIISSSGKSTSRAFALDLRRGSKPAIAVGGADVFCDIPRPAAGYDAERGLHFPLATPHGLLFQNNGKLNDAHGSLQISFCLDRSDAGGQVVRTWGNYFSLAIRPGNGRGELTLAAYGHNLRLAWRWRAGTLYRVMVSWDHTTGLALSLRAGERLLGQVGRTVVWQPYRQQYIPIEIGGTVDEIRPGRTRWRNTFEGWIQDVAAFPLPQEAPGATRVETGSRHPVLRDGLTLLELHDPPLVESPLRFDVIPDRVSNYRQCLRRHPELAGLYLSATDAFQGLLRVGRYVSNLWPHTSYWPWPRAIFEERGDPLLAGIKAGQVGGMCGGYAHVMEEVLWALGVPARRTQVYGHSSLEAYDHLHDKWICLETDNASGHAGCWLDPDGVPYSIGELIDLLEQDRQQPGFLQRRVQHLPLGSQCPAGKIHHSDPESWCRHCYILMGWYRRQDYKAGPPPQYYAYAVPWFRHTPPDSFTPARLQRSVTDWRQLYWSCDRVRVVADWRGARSAIRLHLAPFQAQFFREYQLCLDGVRLRHRQPHFTWRLHPGVNRLEIATRNALGAVGHSWRAVVHRCG